MSSWRDFFAYRSSLSRIGFALVFALAFLSAISYLKWIQILMFVPALAAALFLRSWWEIRSLARGLRVSVHPAEDSYRLVVRSSAGSDFFFRLAYRSAEGEFEFLTRRPDTLSWTMPARASGGEIILYVKWSFDIFRHVVRLPLPTLPAADEGTNRAIATTGEYLHVREYADGDDAGRIDPLRSSLRDKPYVRVTESSEATASSIRKDTENVPIFLESDLPLRPRTSEHGSDLVRWGMIALAFVVIALQWESWLLSGILATTTLLVLAVERFSGGWRGGRIAKNLVMIALFALMVGVSFLMREMTGAGSVFLVQILIVKRLFPDENEDGFLFLFLTLFVFVAVSLFSLAFWFILFFLAYLLLAVLSLGSIAGYADPGALSSAVGTRTTPWRSTKVAGSVFVLMMAFFFVLPHGNTTSSSASALGGGTEAISGFAGEIDLNAVSKIKTDTTKKIVVEDLGPGDQSRFSRAYWRGERFTEFSGGRWRRDWWGVRDSVPPVGSGDRSYSIVYSVFGSDRLFLPVAVKGLDLESSDLSRSVFSPGRDTALYGLSAPIGSPLRIRASFSFGRSGEFADSPVSFEPFEIRIDQEINELFAPFWAKIDPETATNPSLLTAYIRDDAGFSYSVEAPARDLRSFLYEEKRGHCEYFATVLALTLQHFGYPATLVNGFYGGQANELGNAWIIRGADAHSWVEIYDAKKWWRRYDATPTIGTEEEISLLEVSRDVAVSVYDYLDLQWYSHVVGYTGEIQYALLARILAYRAHLAVGAAVLLFGAISFAFARRIRRRWCETDEDRLIRALSDSGGAFALDRLSAAYPQLVAETRRVVYGMPHDGDRSARELSRVWDSKFKKS